MKYLIYILFFVVIVTHSQAQRQAYNWYFGTNSGLSFSPSGATANAVTDGMLSSPEGCAAISDSSGNLLFYTDGATVWNKMHSVMQNGSGLNGTGTATQSAIIIPKPQNNYTYYVFTINSSTKILYYSEIDIRQNAGLGAVIVKNTRLASPVAFKLTATLQRNGLDYWVVTHGFGNNIFYSYSITSAGVNQTPVQTSFGPVHDGSDINATGQMKLAPDGNHIALTLPYSNGYELFEFNNSTGKPGNGWFLGYQDKSPYGVEFSTDCSKFFVSFGSDLIQHDIQKLKAGNADSSRTLIATGTDRFWALQLGPDGKIYVAQNNSTSLGRINNPNGSGTACSYSANEVPLSMRTSQKGLPSFVQSWMTRIYVQSIVNICEGDDVQLTCEITRNAESSYFLWTGPGGFTSTVQNPLVKNVRKNQEGYYKVTVTLGSLVFRDSTYIKIDVTTKARIVPDGSTTLCQGDSLMLFAQPQGSQYSYHWSTGETGNSIKVTAAGRYYLNVSLGGCVFSDSIDINVVPTFTPVITTNGPKVICEGDSMILEAKPETGTDGYLWSTGDTTQKITIRKGGSYTVTINKSGCLRSATINILNLPKPLTRIKALGATSFCTGDSTILIAEPLDPEYSLLWSTGETSASIVVRNTGIITLEVISRNGCSVTDTLEITAGSELKVTIGAQPKPPFCDRDSVILTASPVSTGYTYIWSTGDTTSSVKVAKDGDYSVEVLAPGGCSGRDTITVKFLKSPSAELNMGTSGNICEGDSLLLYPQDYQPGNKYEWSTGQFSPGIYIRKTGNYRLIVTNPSGCSDTTGFDLSVNPKPSVTIKSYAGSTLCIGDTALLVAECDLPGYKILWSTAETADSIVVTSSGKYYVIVENGYNCTTSDSIEMQFNPYPELEILPGNNLTLCPGDTITLLSKNPYFRYEWSTGETTRQINVTQSGNYSLTVYDSTGCRSSASVSVKKADNFINGLDDISFGPVVVWNRSLQKLEFWNTGQDSINIDTIYTLRNPLIFGILGTINPMRLGFSDRIKKTAFFYPEDLGDFADSIVFVLSSPCKETLYVKIEGTGKGSTGIGLPDTSAIIGTKNFRIPLRAKIKSLNNEIVNLSYTAKIRFYADVFLPELLTNGIIRNDTIIDGERIISIEDDNVVVTQTETILTEITGTVLLGNHKITPIKIEDFRWNNTLIDATTKDGSLEAIALCFNDASLIEMGKSVKMKISPNPVSDFIQIAIENPVDGDYTFTIHSVEGVEIMSGNITISNKNSGKTKEFELNMNDFPAGAYIISLSSRFLSIRDLFIKR